MSVTFATARLLLKRDFAQSPHRPAGVWDGSRPSVDTADRRSLLGEVPPGVRRSEIRSSINRQLSPNLKSDTAGW
jgi:hypothetical protein